MTSVMLGGVLHRCTTCMVAVSLVISKPANLSVHTEDELVRVKGDAVMSANIQRINCLPEALSEVVCPE